MSDLLGIKRGCVALWDAVLSFRPSCAPSLERSWRAGMNSREESPAGCKIGKALLQCSTLIASWKERRIWTTSYFCHTLPRYYFGRGCWSISFYSTNSLSSSKEHFHHMEKLSLTKSQKKAIWIFSQLLLSGTVKSTISETARGGQCGQGFTCISSGALDPQKSSWNWFKTFNYKTVWPIHI